jgi:hypothetical protein
VEKDGMTSGEAIPERTTEAVDVDVETAPEGFVVPIELGVLDVNRGVSGGVDILD